MKENERLTLKSVNGDVWLLDSEGEPYLLSVDGDDYNKALNRLAEYETVGTIEEFKALKEKKSEWKYSRKENIATCKNCSYEHYLGIYHQYATNYCPKCGSKMTET